MTINDISADWSRYDRRLIMRVLNSSTHGPWADPDTTSWRLSRNDRVASWLLETWIRLGVPRHTAIMLVGIAMCESGLDPTVVNSESGAQGLYQGLAGEFGRAASSSPALTDHLPIMRVMYEAYDLHEPKSLHALYALHFQYSLISVVSMLDSLRGFVPASGTTYGGQYATTDGHSSCGDLGLMSVTAVIRLASLFSSQKPIMLSVPSTVIDQRSRPDSFFTYGSPVSAFSSANHLEPGQAASAFDLLDLEADSTFRSDANINITYYSFPHDHRSTLGV